MGEFSVEICETNQSLSRDGILTIAISPEGSLIPPVRLVPTDGQTVSRAGVAETGGSRTLAHAPWGYNSSTTVKTHLLRRTLTRLIWGSRSPGDLMSKVSFVAGSRPRDDRQGLAWHHH
jgi:hypothetical protein